MNRPPVFTNDFVEPLTLYKKNEFEKCAEQEEKIVVRKALNKLDRRILS